MAKNSGGSSRNPGDAMTAETEDAELENVLQQIFVECDVAVSTSTLDSMPTGDSVPISRIIDYVQNQLPSWSVDNLMKLWKYLGAVSTNDRVNLHQFKEATKRWIARVQQSTQDGNNNSQEKLYSLVSNADSSMKIMDMNKDIVELELREKFRELCETNIDLHDELERHEASIDSLKQQHSITEKQLKHYVQKCQQLEKENDEQRDQLNELIKKEKTMALALQKYTKEHQNLLKQLEAAEIEIQAIPFLKEKLEKTTKEKTDCMRLIAKMQKEFDEKEDNCSELKTTIIELEDTSINMKESYEYMIHDLREKNRLLADENVELQSLSAFSMHSAPRNKLSLSSVSDIDECCTHSTPYKLKNVPVQDSLYMELKVSGFTAECSRSDRQDLEEELNEYDVAICTILEQLEKVIQFFVTMRGSTDDLSHFNSQDTDARAYNVNVLKHKAALLLYMTTEEVTRRNTRQDSSTQIRADPANAISSLDQFGIRSFQDLLPTYIDLSRYNPEITSSDCTMQEKMAAGRSFDLPSWCNQSASDLPVVRVDTSRATFGNSSPKENCISRPKAETDLRSIASHCVNNEDDDSFLRIIKTYTCVQNQFRIIEPFIEELRDIIESTLGALVDRKDYLPSGNSRYRSIHTLPSSLQSSSLTAEDSQWPRFGCQNPGTNISDAPFARGDGLMQGDHDERSMPLAVEAHDVCDQKGPVCSPENRSYEMPKVLSALQMDSKVLATLEKEKEKTSTRSSSFQVPEVSSASNPTSPRRKISVYCRSFDVVAVQDQHEDQPGSNLEVRQSPSNPDDSPAEVDRFAARDGNSTPGAKYPFSHIYRNTKSDSDSSNSTPRKFQDSLLDDEPPIEESMPRKVRLAPTRLRFLQEAENDLDRNAEVSNDSPVSVNSTELNISDLPPIGEYKEDDDVSVHSSMLHKMEVKSVLGSKSCLNENCVSQGYSMTNHRLFPCNQADSAKLADLHDPHSQASVRRVDSESQSQIERSVCYQMSSCEDSLAVSGSERESAMGSDDRCGIEKKVANEVGKAVNVVSSTSLIDPVDSTRLTSCKNVTQSDEKARVENPSSKTKQDIRQWLLNTKRSYSVGENLDRLEHGCRCRWKNTPLIPDSSQRRVFPSLTDARLQQSGIANLLDSDENWDDLSELELQKRYTAFSLCLSIDRLTLSRRIAMSCRQRDQSERNLSCEVRKMQQDIQELAPLCTDRESVERVERVRHQLDMIVRCAHRVSCVAETLGAVHQELRVSRAVLLADKYLQVLLSRCEKLIANVTETKRILVENNIVIEENSGEPNDELPRIRYRSGTPANNRMMMARRRASVATMSRPMGAQDVTKETVRQRNSVSGRMTLRRPSFSSESPKWEIEKLDRAESSNSISELRGIFEQVESRQSSREENNNMLRPSHSNSQSTINCAIIDNDESNVKEEISPELSDNESINSDSKSSTRLSHSLQLRKRRRRLSVWHIMLSSIVIFCFVFYVIQAMSIANTCHEPLNERLIRCVFDKYRQMRNAIPHPM